MDATQTPYYIIRDALCRAEIIAGATQLTGQIAVPLAKARAALAELERAAAQPAPATPEQIMSAIRAYRDQVGDDYAKMKSAIEAAGEVK